MDHKDQFQKKGTKISRTCHKLGRVGIALGNPVDRNLNLKINQRYVPYKYHLDCGDHLCVNRHYPIPYTHHGLYLGLGLVIHYDFKRVCILTLEEFAKGQRIYKMNSPVTYPQAMIMARAVSRLGEEQYHLVLNNCEHFVRWCRSGKE